MRHAPSSQAVRLSSSSSVRVAEVAGLIAVCSVYALFVYFLPQAGLAIHSDVSWIYRLQVTDDPAVAQAIPYGLEVFGAVPSTLMEACEAHYAAFGRLNCLDIASFRLIAWIAGGNADAWLVIYLATGIAMIGLLYWLVRKLGLPALLAVILVGGALLAPLEVWIGYRTSEPRNAVALLLALVALLTLPPALRNAVAAMAIAVAVQLKEPMIVYWPFVWIFALGIEAREGKAVKDFFWGPLLRVSWPHAVMAVLVLGYMGAVWFLVENRFSYAFIFSSTYPEITAFVTRYWTGLEPQLLQGRFFTGLGLLIVVLGIFVVARAERRRAFLEGWRDPLILATILGGMLAVVAHGAFYYLTKRTIGDDRYINPANIAMILVLAAVLTPLARAAGTSAVKIATLVMLGAVGWHVWRTMPGDPPVEAAIVVTSVCVGAAVLLLTVFANWRTVRRDLRKFAFHASLNAAFAALLIVAIAPSLRDSLHSTAKRGADMQSWSALQKTVASAPQNATVRLATDTPLMIETAWGLQTEMLFAGRGDITLLMEPEDVSFYARETGLVSAAVEAFNANRETADTTEVRTLYTDRRGQQGTAVELVERTWQAWAQVLLFKPTQFFQEGFVDGKSGSLRYSWDEPLSQD